MGDLSSSVVQTQTRKARQFARSPVLFASIQLGKNLQGFILNASEGGVCVQTAKEIVGDEPLDLRFQSVRPGGWVQARGRVVWKNETNTVAGLQFVDNNNEIAREVRHWLSFGESLQELRGNWWPDSAAADSTVPNASVADAPAVERPAAAAPVTLPPVREFAPLPTLPPLSFPVDHASEKETPPAHPETPLLFVPEPAADRERATQLAAPEVAPKTTRFTYDYVRPPSGEERKGTFAMLAAGGACLLLVLIWFALSHRNSPTPQKTEVASNEPASAIPPQPGVNPSSASKPATPSAAVPHAPSAKSVAPARREMATPSRPSVPLNTGVVPTSAAKPNTTALSPAQAAPAGSSQLVIQVGAMAEEANATKLATTLSTQHFPAFVSKHTTDRFYRVLVGPFPNNAALRETETDLQKNSYQTIEKRWTP